MATYYIDYENGNDANSGADWANAWQTSRYGATAARIAAGDIIRFAKSPDPTSVGNATWTQDSDQVELAASPIKNIVNGGEAWTRSANVLGSDTYNLRKVGTYGSSFTISPTFTTGLVAYHTLSSELDLSGYEQISFQIYLNTATVANEFSINLCSDTAGTTPVDTINVPEIAEGSKFYTITIDTAAALGSSIKSIAFNVDTDQGGRTVVLGQVMACKAKSSADSLNLNSLIGLSSDARSLEWYPIRGIVNTTVYLDFQNTNVNSTSGKFTGSTQTVTTYKRDPIFVTPYTANTDGILYLTDSGQIDKPIKYSGGWNTTTNQQDGLTVFDGQNGEGSGIYVASRADIVIDYFGFSRFDRSYLSNLYRDISIRNCFIVNNMDECFYIGTSYRVSIINFFGFGCDDMVLSTSIARMKNLKLESFNRSSKFTITISHLNIQEYQNIENNHWQYLNTGTVNSNDTERHTASGISWEMIPDSGTTEDAPLKFKIGTIAVEKDTETTISVWVKKEHATNVSAKLFLKGGILSGVPDDVEDTKANDTDWEQLSVTFTPTQTTATELWVYGWGNGVDSIYVDDISKA